MTPTTSPPDAISLSPLLFGATVLIAVGAAAESGENKTPIESTDLSGHWSMNHVTTTEISIPVIGDFSTVTEGVLAVEIDQNGTDLALTTRVCSLEMETDLPLVDTVVPDAFVAGLPETTRSAYLTGGDEGDQMMVPPIWDTLGIELADPGSANLPEDDSDPRIFDQDGDGNPGATLRIDGPVSGEIYVVRRGWESWRGQIQNRDRVEGQIRWATEQHVIGASNRLLRRQPQAEPAPNGDQHYFRMHRVDEPPC